MPRYERPNRNRPIVGLKAATLFTIMNFIPTKLIKSKFIPIKNKKLCLSIYKLNRFRCLNVDYFNNEIVYCLADCQPYQLKKEYVDLNEANEYYNRKVCVYDDLFSHMEYSPCGN